MRLHGCGWFETCSLSCLPLTVYSHLSISSLCPGVWGMSLWGLHEWPPSRYKLQPFSHKVIFGWLFLYKDPPYPHAHPALWRIASVYLPLLLWPSSCSAMLLLVPLHLYPPYLCDSSLYKQNFVHKQINLVFHSPGRYSLGLSPGLGWLAWYVHLFQKHESSVPGIPVRKLSMMAHTCNPLLWSLRQPYPGSAYAVYLESRSASSRHSFANKLAQTKLG